MDFNGSIDNVYNNSIKAIQDASGKLLLTYLGEMKPRMVFPKHLTRLKMES